MQLIVVPRGQHQICSNRASGINRLELKEAQVDRANTGDNDRARVIQSGWRTCEAAVPLATLLAIHATIDHQTTCAEDIQSSQ